MPTRALLTLFARSRTSITAAPRPRARRPLMRSTSSFFVRQRRAVSPSRPAILDGAARSGWSRLAGAHRRRRLGLDHPEHGATLGYRRASLLANLLSRTDDRWQRAGHEVKVLPRSPIVAPPLRHPCAPLALLRSTLPQSGRSPLRLARPSVVPGRVGS